MRLPTLIAALLATAGAQFAPAALASYLERAEVRAFIDEVVERNRLNKSELLGLFKRVNRQDKVLAAIARPYEAKPWKEYRPIFLTESRIDEGAAFWARHEALLARVEEAYGVPVPLLIAIIGVETRYGRHAGAFPAFDTLTTLAFDYPPRSGFFKRELESFLLLARDEQLDPRGLKGSYAAAMGVPQFISSSYREYAVDYDGDGRRDLFNSIEDVLASVANYFVRHGWRAGEPVVWRAEVQGTGYRELLSKGLAPERSADQLRAAGVAMPQGGPEPLSLIELDGAQGPEVWVGYPNFYVITRYNHSALYALAVHQLSEAIAQRAGTVAAGSQAGR